MLERLRHNLFLKVLSVTIALAAWAYLRLTPNPIIATARFVQTISVPIATTGLRPEQIAHFNDKQAVVAIEVPRGGAEISPDTVRAVLALDGRGPGVYNVPVEVIAPKFNIKSLSPASVTLSIERIEQRTLPVVPHYVGELRHNVVVQNVTLYPSYAILRAPTSEIARVSSVQVDLPLPGNPSALDAMLRPVAMDERGNEISSVAVSPNLVRVRARFTLPSGAK